MAARGSPLWCAQRDFELMCARASPSVGTNKSIVAYGEVVYLTQKTQARCTSTGNRERADGSHVHVHGLSMSMSMCGVGACLCGSADELQYAKGT